jgi:hypothetical protein
MLTQALERLATIGDQFRQCSLSNKSCLKCQRNFGCAPQLSRALPSIPHRPLSLSSRHPTANLTRLPKDRPIRWSFFPILAPKTNPSLMLRNPFRRVRHCLPIAQQKLQGSLYRRRCSSWSPISFRLYVSLDRCQDAKCTDPNRMISRLVY